MAAYGTSKWGIRGLTRISAKELGRENIRVNGVHPGIIETPLAYAPATGELIVSIDDQPIPRLADVDEIGSLVLFIASDDDGCSTGAEFVADSGYLLGPVPATEPLLSVPAPTRRPTGRACRRARRERGRKRRAGPSRRCGAR
ncbi:MULTISPECIES: SDR family NAD(P)-dependent oxidoreductase [unclassified Streptomyces]|uniref:SDR family NAD(P)-dependent oxidoreductase n=1 Tax=unclassified Streptomyces TaxID=2593676 RepID=UPI00386BD4EC